MRRAMSPFIPNLIIMIACCLFNNCRSQQQWDGDWQQQQPSDSLQQHSSLPNNVSNNGQPSAQQQPQSQLRAKRQYGGSSQNGGPSSSCGCLSKFTPVNCKCTSTANDDLLCRCDRAILATLRDEPADRASSFCPCRRSSGVDSGFRGEISELASRVHNLAGIHSACHPICHQSCLNTCTRPREREMVDSPPPYRDRYGGPSPLMANDAPPSHSPVAAPNRMQMDSPYEPLPGCQPSHCRANCLRACSRILDGQSAAVAERAPSAPFQENLSVEPPPHFEVRPADTFAKPMPEYPTSQPANGENGPSPCQCSSAGGFCDCPDACLPVCLDSCEANCNQHSQGSQSQRRLCAQSCHFECQRNCAEKQRQKRPLDGEWTGAGVAEGNELTASPQLAGGGNGNNVWAAGNAPTGNAEMSQQNGIFGPGGPNCMAKCPKSCEAACLTLQNDDPVNCVPACVAVCAQSCSQGLQSDNLPQPLTQMRSQQQFQQQQAPPRFQSGDGQFAQQLMEGLAPKMMNSQSPTFAAQGLPAFGRKQQQQQQNMQTSLKWNGTNLRMDQQNGGEMDAEKANSSRQPNNNGLLPSTMFLNDVRPFRHPPPCAPLCQPQCRMECTRRYMEERRPEKRYNRGFGGQPATDKPFGYPMGQQLIGQMPQQWSAARNGFSNGDSSDQQQFGQQSSPNAASHSAAVFPPHYILPPLDDDLELEIIGNGTMGVAMDEPPPIAELAKVAMDDVDLLLKPQNETGLAMAGSKHQNSTKPEAKSDQKSSKENVGREEKIKTMKPLTLAKPWKGKMAGGNKKVAEEFFKQRVMGKLAAKVTGAKKAAIEMTTAHSPPVEMEDAKYAVKTEEEEGSGRRLSQPKWNLYLSH